MLPETFHVYLVSETGRSKWRVDILAQDANAAKERALRNAPDGASVEKVRRAPHRMSSGNHAERSR